MLSSLLYKFQSKLKTRQITHNGQPYLERSYLGTIFGKRIYLHRFVACDEDGLHDHPFLRSWSFLISGWYFEDRWSCRRKVMFFNYIGPDRLHRIVLPQNGRDVWTLFTHTARVKPWGLFRKHESHVEWKNMSEPGDPAFSDWSKDSTAGQLREKGLLFNIPPGKNAYGAGIIEYPGNAVNHKDSIGR